MAAAAVEKSATFSRGASYSSRNSQLGMANIYYLSILCKYDDQIVMFYYPEFTI
jgi:hypothetical protein